MLLPNHNPGKKATVTTYSPTMLVLPHSQQPANQYAGGGTGQPDSEQAWMRKLALEIAAEVEQAGHPAPVSPLGKSYADNVAWAKQAPQASAPALLSCHSNATGKPGTTAKGIGIYYCTSAGEKLARSLRPFLEAINPPGGVALHNERVASIITQTPQPAMLVEWEYHDWTGSATEGGADWIRADANRTAIAKAVRAWWVSLHGEKAAEEPSSGDGTPADPDGGDSGQDGGEPDVFGPAFPLPDGSWFGPKDGPAESVSGYYNRRANGKRGHDGLATAQGRLAELGLYTGQVDGLWGPLSAAATGQAQTLANGFGAGLLVDQLLGANTWPWLWKLDAPTTDPGDAEQPAEPDPSTDVDFRVGAYNSELPQWGGNTNYAGDGEFLRDNLSASIYLLEETNEPMRNAIRRALGGLDRWLVHVAGSSCVIWDSTKYDRGTPRSVMFGVYQGALLVPLTSRKNGRTLYAVVVHIRPGAVTDLAGKHRDIRRVIDLIGDRSRVVVGGDWNTSTARKLMEAAGFKLATPFTETHDKGYKLDFIFTRGLGIRTGGGVKNPGRLSDHRGIFAQLTLPGKN